MKKCLQRILKEANNNLQENKLSFFIPWLGTNLDEDDLYRRLRDDPRGSDLKDRIEVLWKEYESVDPDRYRFLREAQINFHQRWWEMYLTVGLLHASRFSSYKVETSKQDKGPDIKVTTPDGERIWIEAVAPDPGTGSDRVPEHEEDGVFDVPNKECLLRLYQALKMKQEKFEEYQHNGFVDRDDPCIIAISSCALNQFGHLLDFPCPAPLSVIAGADKMVLRRNNPPYITKRQSIEKKSGFLVNTCAFEDPSFDIISAVLYSSEDPLNAPLNPESTFQLFLNPRATNRLPKYFICHFSTWYCKNDRKDEEWKKVLCGEQHVFPS